MQVNKQRLEQLFNKWLTHNITEGETEELMDLLQEAGNEEREGLLKDAYEGVKEKSLFSPEQIEGMANLILGKKHQAPVFTLRRLVAAASIILVIGLGSYFLFFDKSRTPAEVVQTVAPANDIKAPENNRAMITLADGKRVELDSVTSGMLAQQGNVKLVKLADGQISYQTSTGEIIKELQYNTLSNPRGSKVIDMTLEDGSRVWLNAGSSITYPVAFVGKERKVNITGEAYFEISHEASKPFKVTKGDIEVAVLGTHFNVNAYDDEKEIRVTLLEGSVKVITKNNGRSIKSEVIKPGQQARLVNNQISILSSVDTDGVMAWKNGKFSFYRDDIKTVMRQLARWYDLEVVYQGELTKDKFGGDIHRDLPLSETLGFLKESKVNFEIQGRKVIVKK